MIMANIRLIKMKITISKSMEEIILIQRRMNAII